MRTPGFSERIANVTAKDRCRWCCDNGWVVVAVRIDQHVHRFKDHGVAKLRPSTARFEEMGPCPMCQRGYFEEFGDAEHQTKAPGIKPPWGAEGFWAQQPSHIEIVSLEDVNTLPLPKQENTRRMRDLLDGMAGIGRQVDEAARARRRAA